MRLFKKLRERIARNHCRRRHLEYWQQNGQNGRRKCTKCGRRWKRSGSARNSINRDRLPI